MPVKPFISLTVLAVALGCPGGASAYTNGITKIGVLNDMSGTYADLSGRGSVIAARMAVEDFGADAKGMKVFVGAHHKNKPDVGSMAARPLSHPLSCTSAWPRSKAQAPCCTPSRYRIPRNGTFLPPGCAIGWHRAPPW